MSVHDLEQMLSRYEYGRLHAARLERELRDELQRLIDARAAQGTPFAASFWQAASLFKERDAALRVAATAIDAGRFREAVREIRHCADAIAAADEFMEASTRVDGAEQSVQAVGELAAATVLRGLPAVASLRQLAGTMSFRMMEGRYGAAAALADLCTRMTGPLLLRRPPDDDERVLIEDRIAAIEELYEATSMVAADSEPDVRQDGSIGHLRKLVRENYLGLAKRLLIELEIGLASRRRFRLHVRRALTVGEAAALKTLVTAHGWDAALDHETLQAIAGEGATLARHAERAATNAADLDAALADETQET